jgi:hypothetical protein
LSATPDPNKEAEDDEDEDELDPEEFEEEFAEDEEEGEPSRFWIDWSVAMTSVTLRSELKLNKRGGCEIPEIPLPPLPPSASLPSRAISSTNNSEKIRV